AGNGGGGRRREGRPPQGRERRRRLRGLQGYHLVRPLGRGGATRREFEKMTIPAVMRSLAAGALLLAEIVVAGAQEAKPELSRVRLAAGGEPAVFYLPLAGAGGAGRLPRRRVRGEGSRSPG